MGHSVHVWTLPEHINNARSGAAVIVDLLRASTTITRALTAGAVCVVPCLVTEDALGLRGAGVVLGGERGGLRIAGFDLGNSPREYTPETVGGKTLVFTTTNGTRAIDAARRAGAAKILVGCFNNLSAVIERVCTEHAVHILCAGTNGAVSEEDVLCAGAIATILTARGFAPAATDGTVEALAAWQSVTTALDRPHAIRDAMRASRGGRNLVALGLDADIDDCASIDTCVTVAELGADGALRSAR